MVLAVLTPVPFEAVADQIRDLAANTPVLLGGDGADPEMAGRLGARALDSDPISAAAGMPAL